VVAYGPGGATDISARHLAAVATKYIPVPLLVVNRTGAGGATGTAFVANAPGDGYTMMVARVGSHTVDPAMKANLPYSIDDFRYVGVYEIGPVICATSPQSGITGIEQPIEAVKERPGELSCSSSGVGSMLHPAGVLVLDAFGIEKANGKVVHLPFCGDGEAARQVIAGNATYICTNSSALMGHIQSGALVPLIVTTPERLEGVDAPTARELGHPELGALVGSSGIAGPKSLVDEAFDAWVGWLDQITQDEEFLERMKKLGSIVVRTSPEESVEFIRNQYNVFETLVDKLGMRIE
jgi:tripartite-type tricarboxylate transporter receptor subunit TctC